MRRIKRKQLNYIIYLVSITLLIFIAFNTYFTIQIHNQLAEVASKPGRWPAGAYIYDPNIGFDFASNVSGEIKGGDFYVKSHQFGYRIDKEENPASFRSGGVLSLGCSYTYGDEVESGQTFTQFAADGLRLPAYNYGVCSFSYIHALLKARNLKENGILDKLKPKYVILGCWSGLTKRSRTPFPPTTNQKLPLLTAYITKDGNETTIEPPVRIGNVFRLIDIYRTEGPAMSGNKFFSIFLAAPRYLYQRIKNNKILKNRGRTTFSSKVTDYEIYDFYFTAIEELFSTYDSQIIVLYMPATTNEHPGGALKRAIKDHPEILFVNGLDALDMHQVPSSDYHRTHPKPAAHNAYAKETIKAARRSLLKSWKQE